MEMLFYPSEQLATVYQFIGVVGFVLYLVGFAALQIGRLDGNGQTYTMVNITAAIMVLISLIGEFNLASALIQVSWICIGVFGLMPRKGVKLPINT